MGISVRSGSGSWRSVVLLSLMVPMLLGGCRSREERAARYAGQYEAAVAGNDPWSARVFMQQAVQYKDDNPEYWVALGKVQLQLADYAGAYYSYSRANELDRSNADVLQTLADLAVMSGHLPESRDFARQVLLLQPSNLMPQATLGFVALRDHKYADAIKQADVVLAARANDSNAMILKARAMASTGDFDAAARLLKTYLTETPKDEAALKTLASIYDKQGNVAGKEFVGARLLVLHPEDPDLQLAYARTLYALGQRERAWEMTTDLIRSGKQDGRLTDILGLWLHYEPHARSIAQVRSLIPGADAGDRAGYAFFLILAGQPAEAQALLAPDAALPVTALNITRVVLLARALDGQGKTAEALRLLDAAVTFDETNSFALRTRTDILLRTGKGPEAFIDAQRLVAENPQSPYDRIRLARSYAVQGKQPLAERSYRTAFQAIPASPLIHDRLRGYLIEIGKGDDVAAVDQAYGEQRETARGQWQ
jgi:predicted Zn-dependent protease